MPAAERCAYSTLTHTYTHTHRYTCYTIISRRGGEIGRSVVMCNGSAHLSSAGRILRGTPSPTAFKNMPTSNGRIIPGSLLMNPIRQSLVRGKNACARFPSSKTLSPLHLYSYCFTLRHKLRGGVYLESHTLLYPLSSLSDH